MTTMMQPMFRSIPEPVTRYAGGKGRLVHWIRCNMPAEWGNYVEPFCGGLAYYCAMVNEYWDTKCYSISDLNEDLIRVYKYIRDAPKDMFDILWGYHLTHSPEQWHQLSYHPRDDETELELAARYWYLMRHSYSNKMGSSKNKWIGEGAMTASYYGPSLQRTMALSDAFNRTRTQIECLPYYHSIKWIMPGDFVYLDPPYLGASNAIYQNMMSNKDHVILANWAKEVAFERGAYVMISNYDSEEARELYSDFRFESKPVSNKMRNDDGHRGVVQELLAMSY